jgi:hypothetical protein
VRKKLAVVLAAVVLVVLYLHRAVVHEVIVDAAIALASLAGLCLVTAGLVHAAGRKPVQPARRRVAVQPAAIERPRASRPGDPCAEACGRPATRMFEQWPVCTECGGRLDAAAGRPVRPAGIAPEPADDDIPVLTQPPVIPAGETIGTVDMTEFERAHRSD